MLSPIRTMGARLAGEAWRVRPWIFIFLFAVVFFVTPELAKAANEVINFNVDKNFDISGRAVVTAKLIKTSNNAYFYIEEAWWNLQDQAKKDKVLNSLNNLSLEFDNRIYPVLTSMFGQEVKPGIDNDNRITILFENINSGEGGYFRESDGYIKLQTPISNEKEMVYLSLNYIEDPKLKAILAHEFVHLITFNQKNKILSIEEDVWLNETRADYSSAILGYDDVYEGSNLQQRVKDFIKNYSDSVTEWTGGSIDYASSSMFMHYLVDHYGVNILIDSLKSKYTGIESLNYALEKNNFKVNFSEIFTNWTVTLALNNCSISENYCYLNPNLKNFRILPVLNFLPVAGDVSLSAENATKNWSGNWLKFIGGNGNLELDFSSYSWLTFKIPYIIEDSSGNYTVKFLKLDDQAKGKIFVEKFGTDFKSLLIMPSIQSDFYSISEVEELYPFNYTVKIKSSIQLGDQELIKQLLNRIAYLKNEIAKLQNGGSVQNSCFALNNNLYFGMTNNDDVKCLQQFLKNEGQNIYPEGLITGNFLSLTKSAVIRFQEKYQILNTGFVGPITRTKINELLK